MKMVHPPRRNGFCLWRGLTLLLVVCCCSSLLDQAQAVLVEYELNVTRGWINPDCSEYNGYELLINNQFQGPLLTAITGDTVRVKVHNQMAKGVYNNLTLHNTLAIHFHGIQQFGTPESDGVPYVNQDPIQPGETYIYEFKVIRQAGTFFYHGHVGLQEGMVSGPFIVYPSEKARARHHKRMLQDGPFEYHEEHVISISEWWHTLRESMEAYITGPANVGLVDANSVLLNGQTVNNPLIYTPGCLGFTTLEVEHGKTYRLRIIGAMAFRTYAFAIANHNLTVIEVDGELVKPYPVSFVEVSSGQRVSVLLHANQPPADYAIATTSRYLDVGTIPLVNGKGILHYKSSTPVNRWALPAVQPVFPPEKPFWIWFDLEPLFGANPVVREKNARTVVLDIKTAVIGGLTKWLVNNEPYIEATTPLLTDILHGNRTLDIMSGVQANGYSPVLRTYPLRSNEIVDFVIQLIHVAGTPCREHPWHTHGHSHYPLAYGIGQYDEVLHGNHRNTTTPIFRDTILVHNLIDPALETRTGQEVGCGWVKFRLVADNPGVWAMHCHNNFHMVEGMMAILEEATDLIPARNKTARNKSI